MNRVQLLCTLALALTATAALAQPDVELCDAPWMDAQRVQALLAVEFGGQSEASQVAVQSCTGDSAEVVVRFGADDAAARASQLDLSQTAVGARSRLVALVIAELVRLGPPRVPSAESSNESPAEDVVAAPVAEGAAEDVVVATPPEDVVLAQDVIVATAAGAPQHPEDATENTEPESTPEETLAVETPAVETPLEDSVTEPDRCEGWSRFGRGPCSWGIAFGYGAAFHQLGLLGESRTGSAFLHQLRLIGRWRYLFGGVRMYGFGVLRRGPDGQAGGATAMAGVEWWARRWSKNVLALRTGIEAGVQGFRNQFGGVCDFECASFSEPTVGAFASVRYERSFGILRGAVELELGWSTGFRIDQSQQLITGLGGPWLSLNVDLSIGRAE